MSNKDVVEGLDYLKQIADLKQRCELVASGQGKGEGETRELYKVLVSTGTLYFKLFAKDGVYYNYAQWQLWETHRYSNPVFWDIGDIDKLCELIDMPQVKYTVYSSRVYGEPKLTKPKELKNVKSIGSAVFIPKHCSPQVFIQGNDVYIKHTDFFSEMWQPPADDIGKDQSYYCKKYFNQDRNKKFVYADNWGAIVLRNEAWLCIKDMVCAMKYMNELQMARELCKQMGLQEPWREWEDFYVNVYRLVKDYESNKDKE